MNSQFDWYELSKLCENKPNPQKFNEIIQNSKMSVKNIPIYHRKKLLIMFQNVSYHMKDLYMKQK